MKKWARIFRRFRKYGFAFAICCTPGPHLCAGGSALVATYGYLEVRPPSALFEPGAMIALLHEKPLEAAIVCGPRGSLGSDHVAERSRTMGQSLSKLNQKTFDLDVTFTENIRANARFRQIQHISMEINNARITEVGDEAVIRGRRRRSPDCQACIDNRISAGFKPVMISSALSGDMIFHIHWETSAQMSAKAKIDTLSQLAVELGGGAHSITESTITVSNLVFGIRYSRYLAALSMPDIGQTSLDLDAPRPDDSVSLQSHRSPSIRIEPVPDAPVVLPGAYDPSKQGWIDHGDRREFIQPLPSLPSGSPLLAPHRAPTSDAIRRNLLGAQKPPGAPSAEPQAESLRSRSRSM